MTDPIADMLTRIRNAVTAKHTRVDMPLSRIKSDIAKILQDEGYKTTTSDSGEAALEAVRKRAFDVVLLDIWLPGMDGLEVLQAIREMEEAPVARGLLPCLGRP